MRFLRGAACAATLAFAGAAPAATILIVNGDSVGEGFNDPTPVSAEGGNTGTTRGQQRLNVFQAAANIWGAQLTSNVTIRVRAQFNPFPGQCDTSGGVLGFAGPVNVVRDFTNAPRANTWYGTALANSLAGTDQDPGNDDIESEFNSDVDAGCLGAGTRFWYGTTSASPTGNRVNLLPTVLHEMGHGLGFISLVCVDSGGCGSGNPQGANLGGINDVWNFSLAGSSNPSLKWSSMTNAQRATLITSETSAASKLVWTGTNVTAALNGFITNGTTAGFLRMYAPNPVEPGSSVSHFTTAASPNLLMEPAITSTIFSGTDLTVPLFRDIGWTASGGAVPNQAPTINAPASIPVTEDVPSGLAGISFNDTDAGTGSLTATFTVATGTLNATSGGGVTVATIAGGKTLAGTLTALNAYIAAGSLTYTTALNAQGAVSLSVGLNDNGNTGTGGAQTASRSVTLNIQAANDAPTLTSSASVPVVEDVLSNVTGISIADIDAGSGSMTLTLAVSSGTLTATTSGGVTVTGTATSRVLSGTVVNVNSYVGGNNVRFTTASNSTAAVTLSLTLSDNGNTGAGGARTATASTTLQPTATNDAPVLVAPTTIETSIVAPSPLTGITASDVDAASGNVSLQFIVTAGTLTATAGGGVAVAGSGTGTVALTGTISAVAAYLAATPPSYDGPAATLSLTLNDGGNTGSGGAGVASATVQLVPSFLLRDGFEGG